MPSVTDTQPAKRHTVQRATVPALRGWTGGFWAGETWAAGGVADPLPSGASRRERVLPTGNMHLVFRLTGPRLRLYESAEEDTGHTIGPCIVGGPRDAAYVRSVDSPAWSVGVELRPGTSTWLFGVPADALAGAHWCLEDLWGTDATRLRDRLLEARDPLRQIGLLEQELLHRMSAAQALHPAVAFGLARLRAGGRIGAVVRESGVSHRRFITLFRDAIGLTPKAWSRVLRFRRAIRDLAADSSPAARIAAAEFSDQPHFNREFRRIAGMTPAEYRRSRPAHPNHVPMTR